MYGFTGCSSHSGPELFGVAVTVGKVDKNNIIYPLYIVGL